MGKRYAFGAVICLAVLLLATHNRAIDRLSGASRAVIERAVVSGPVRTAPTGGAERIGFAELAGDALFAGRAGPARHVALAGFALPLEQRDDGRVTKLLLARSAFDCCYGRVPAPDEWVLVVVPEGTLAKGAVEVEGWLERVRETDETGALAGLYRVDALRVDPLE